MECTEDHSFLEANKAGMRKDLWSSRIQYVSTSGKEVIFDIDEGCLYCDEDLESLSSSSSFRVGRQALRG